MKALYRKYDPGTCYSRELYRIVCETRDLRPLWAHRNAMKWEVDLEEFRKLCETACSCCGSALDYGLGKNNISKLDINTPSTDHIISRKEAKLLGWTDEQTNHISNLWIICNRCNRLKNDSTAEDIHRYTKIIELHKKIDKKLL